MLSALKPVTENVKMNMAKVHYNIYSRSCSEVLTCTFMDKILQKQNGWVMQYTV